MVAQNLINTEFTPLAPSDSVGKALAKMDAWQTTSLPIVEPATGKLIGRIGLEQLADLEDEMSISLLTPDPPVSVHPHQHIFEIARQMFLHEVRLIPVIRPDETCEGVVEKKRVLNELASMLNVTVSGSVIAVEIESGDFTLSELVQLIESEGAKILGVTVQTPAEPAGSWQVSFKLNVLDTSAISQSLRRYGYYISSETRSELLHFDISDRADELLRYLDV